jgi:hypothetical protein
MLQHHDCHEAFIYIMAFDFTLPCSLILKLNQESRNRGARGLGF